MELSGWIFVGEALRLQVQYSIKTRRKRENRRPILLRGEKVAPPPSLSLFHSVSLGYAEVGRLIAVLRHSL